MRLSRKNTGNWKFYGYKDEKIAIHSQEEMDAILKGLDGAVYQVAEVKKGERTKKAPLPFTTSTLQQDAGRALNFSTQKTMRLAWEWILRAVEQWPL